MKGKGKGKGKRKGKSTGGKVVKLLYNSRQNAIGKISSSNFLVQQESKQKPTLLLELLK